MIERVIRITPAMVLVGLQDWGLHGRIQGTGGGNEGIVVKEAAATGVDYWLITDDDLGIDFASDDCPGVLVGPYDHDGCPYEQDGPAVTVLEYADYPDPASMITAIAEVLCMGRVMK